MSTSVPVISVSRPRRCQDRGGGGLIIIGATWVPLEYPPDINSNSTTHTDTTQHFPTVPLKHTHMPTQPGPESKDLPNHPQHWQMHETRWTKPAPALFMHFKTSSSNVPIAIKRCNHTWPP